MPLIAVDVTGKQRSVIRGARLGAGASAEVYREIGGFKKALKLYSSDYLSKYADQRDRIVAMLERPPSGQETAYQGRRIVQIAWPNEILQDGDSGRFVGFSMPLVDKSGAVELEILKTRINRRQSGIREDLTFRLNVVRNLAALVKEIHRAGHTIVDLKPLNLMVYSDLGFVAILDCDGFGVRSNVKTFPGALATDSYRAPESAHMPTAGFGPKQDDFTLAVIIFELMNDAHPFTGRPRRDIPNTLQERIYGGLYAYGYKSHAAIAPIITSQHATWPTSLRQMFDNAFAGKPDLRPTAKNWQDALDYLKTKLQRCLQNPHHEYFGDTCPHCPSVQAAAQPRFGNARSPGRERERNGSLPYRQIRSNVGIQQPWKAPWSWIRSRRWRLRQWWNGKYRKKTPKLVAIITFVVIGAFAFSHQGSTIKSGSAIVDHTLQLHVRNCPTPSCDEITTLDEGDYVFVTKAFSNGWNAVTVRFLNGSVLKGFVNGAYLTPR